MIKACATTVLLIARFVTLGGGPYIIEEAYPLQSRSVVIPSGYGYPAALDR